MEKEKFQQWCNIQESKLFRRFISLKISELAVAIFYGWMFIAYLVIKQVLNNLKENFIIFNYIPKIAFGWIFGVILVILFIFVAIKILKWLTPLSKVEFLSCMINKLANQLQFIKETSKTDDLVRLLKELGVSVKFERKFSSADLFKTHKQFQNKFYDQLEDLPKRIFHAFKNNSLDKIDVAQLKDLAYYIFVDNDQKVDVLNSISSNYPQTLNLNKIGLLDKIKPHFEKKWLLIIIWLLILSVFAYVAYSYIGIDKNSTFIGFIGLLVVIAYIVYKK